MNEHTDPIVERVREKLLSRSQAGIAKYGTTLARTDLTRREWLQHLQDELLDGAEVRRASSASGRCEPWRHRTERSTTA